jgi:hypothetical protein
MQNQISQASSAHTSNSPLSPQPVTFPMNGIGAIPFSMSANGQGGSFGPAGTQPNSH